MIVVSVCLLISLSLSSGPGDNVPAVYGLDVTDLSQWEETVLSPALLILDRLTKVETVFQS